MNIGFNQIPNNIRINFVAVEFDNSKASEGPSLLPYRGLILSQKAGGTGVVHTLYLVTSADRVGELAGRTSLAFRQAVKWFENNDSTETWLMLVADNAAGVAAAGSITFTAPATADGTLHFYVGDRYVPVGIANGDSILAMGQKVEDAVDAQDGLPVIATDDALDSCDFVFTHKGEAGNGLKLAVNLEIGQKLPAGVAYTITQPTGGTTNPTLTSAISALGDEWFQIINHPWTDATSLTALENEMSSRFGPMRQLDGLLITSAAGSLSTLTTLGNTRNSQHSVIMAQPGPNVITPPYEFGAAVAASVAYYGQIDPARPFQTLALVGCKQPKVKFTDTERNTLLWNGIGASLNADGGVVRLDRVITTYKTNPAGASDVSYLDATTLLTLLYLRWSFKNVMRLKYPRHKLANDGSRAAAGQPIMTPLLGKTEAVNWFKDMEQLGLVESPDLFKKNLKVVRNSNVNQLDFLLPPDLINQLIVTAGQIQFRL